MLVVAYDMLETSAHPNVDNESVNRNLRSISINKLFGKILENMLT